MFSWSHHLKVVRIVVQSVAIFMVNNFIRCQSATKHVFHYKAMLSLAPVVVLADNVSLAVDTASTASTPFSSERIAVDTKQSVVRHAHAASDSSGWGNFLASFYTARRGSDAFDWHKAVIVAPVNA